MPGGIRSIIDFTSSSIAGILPCVIFSSDGTFVSILSQLGIGVTAGVAGAGVGVGAGGPPGVAISPFISAIKADISS